MRIIKLSVLAGIAGMMVMASSVQAQQASQKEETGKDIAFSDAKGNCLACHGMPTQPDAQAGGSFGPPLIAMSARFPDRTALRAKIWDPTVSNPNTSMPPFGKHKVLTEQEIDKVTDFIYSL